LLQDLAFGLGMGVGVASDHVRRQPTAKGYASAPSGWIGESGS
jgi:hypothetical protein